MAGPVTSRETSAVSRALGRASNSGPSDIRDQYRREAMLKWLRDREKTETRNVRTP